MPWLRAYKATDNRSSLRSGVAEITVSDDVVVHVTEHGSVCFTAKIWVVPRNLFRPLHLCGDFFMPPLLKVTPHSVGRCREATEGTTPSAGDRLRWRDSLPISETILKRKVWYYERKAWSYPSKGGSRISKTHRAIRAWKFPNFCAR